MSMVKDSPKRGGAWRTGEKYRTAGGLEVITLDPTQSRRLTRGVRQLDHGDLFL